ncbi:MAG: 2-amino-4-hydroxy-6-hydroxymethyldihydropteridine diphosphokinase [Pseudomonadota bacterium]
MSTAWIGLGSNQNDPQHQLDQALLQLDQLPDSALVQVSSRYWTPPWGDVHQLDYLNAVAILKTRLAPQALLNALQFIEANQGRVRDPHRRWGPRVLDLDLLLYDDQRFDTPSLQVPHPRMTERAFVLVPLNELSPLLMIPGQGSVEQALAEIDSSQIRRAENQ